jgi:hypothetical protein
MALRVCNVAGCPELVEQGRCAEHRRAYETKRGSRQARGYGAKHTALRERWARKVATGQVNCWRCGERLSPLEPWDLGHDDRDRTITRGPECLPCNRSTAAR